MNQQQTQNWDQLKLVSGRLCLDFVNTVDRAADHYLQEWLQDAIDLIGWAKYLNILSAKQARSLIAQVKQQPEKAAIVFEQAIQLRETLYRIFSAIAAQNPQQANDIKFLNARLSEMQSHLQLSLDGSRFTWEWTETNQLEFILWQIVRSTAELLTASERDRIRECAGVDCGWVFLDLSRNHSRRWCDMEDCGNRAKANRYYDRNRKK